MKKRILSFVLSMCVLSNLPTSNVKAADRQLNIKFRVGESEFGAYGVATYMQTRYDLITARVYGYYRAAFGIPINFISEPPWYVVSSVADTCKGYNSSLYDYFCGCSADKCSNSGPYHHTNTHVIKDDLYVFPHDSRNAAWVYLTAVSLCTVSNAEHKGVYGITDTSNKIITVRDYDYIKDNDTSDGYEVTYVCKTLIHEIGHLYGVQDHYNTYYGDDTKDKCIWGYYKDTDEVAEKLMICPTCRQTIIDNADRYTHT